VKASKDSSNQRSTAEEVKKSERQEACTGTYFIQDFESLTI
jgi:hypothetical protein